MELRLGFSSAQPETALRLRTLCDDRVRALLATGKIEITFFT
jgi:hypothetical protein